MDPDACLRRIADATDRRERSDACEDLFQWLKRGGFEPAWDNYPKGLRRYAAWRAERFRQEVGE